MKKLFIVLLSVLCFGLTGCEKQRNSDLRAEIEKLQSENESLKQSASSVIDTSREEMSETQTKTEIPTSVTTTEPEQEPEPVGIWEIRYYVDEFKQPTSKGYISTIDPVEGIFSNSATTNSYLDVVFMIDEEGISIALYEYGSNRVKNSYSRSVWYDVTIRLNDDTRYSNKCIMFSDNDRIYFYDEDFNEYSDDIIRYLKEEETVSFYIAQEDRAINTYLFTVETAGFSEQYQLLG